MVPAPAPTRRAPTIRRIPTTIRYAAPTSFTTVNAVADDATSADRPTVAAATCTRPPLATPARGDEPGAAALVDALRDDVRHRRPGHDRERDRREAEERERGRGRHQGTAPVEAEVLRPEAAARPEARREQVDRCASRPSSSGSRSRAPSSARARSARGRRRCRARRRGWPRRRGRCCPPARAGRPPAGGRGRAVPTTRPSAPRRTGCSASSSPGPVDLGADRVARGRGEPGEARRLAPGGRRGARRTSTTASMSSGVAGADRPVELDRLQRLDLAHRPDGLAAEREPEPGVDAARASVAGTATMNREHAQLGRLRPRSRSRSASGSTRRVARELPARHVVRRRAPPR